MPSALAADTLIRVAPKTINFGSVPVGVEVLKGATITNTSGSDLLLLVEGGLPDDFGFGLLPGSTCPALTPGDVLAAGERCDVVVRWTSRYRSPSRSSGLVEPQVRAQNVTTPWEAHASALPSPGTEPPSVRRFLRLFGLNHVHHGIDQR
jgi:hypothetical protein